MPDSVCRGTGVDADRVTIQPLASYNERPLLSVGAKPLSVYFDYGD